MIDEKVLLQSRPEALNDMMDMDLQNQKGGYNNGWNDCLFYFIDIIKKQPKVGEWIPFTFDEEGALNCPIPEANEKMLVTDGKRVWQDMRIGYDGYAFGCHCELYGILAWMPLPKPYKEKEDE